MRHFLEGAARYASEVAPVPIVNAGDGANQHPSQTMLDLYSIYKTQGTLENLNIYLVGDLKYGRTVHSLLMAMRHFNPTFHFIAPEELKMPEEYKIYCKEHNIKYKEYTDFNEETIADADIHIIKAVQELQRALHLSDEQFEITSHIDSGIYYIFNQPESLRNNSVVLFGFNSSGLDYYRFDITHNKSPEIVDVFHQNLKDRLTFSAFKKDDEELDEQFAAICQELLAETYVSSVFLTGIGFADNWLKESATILCQGRRVFVGQNIYTKGACYRAFGDRHSKVLDRYLIRSEYTVGFDIGISLNDDSKTFVPITRGGQEWFHTKGKLYIFPDESNQVELIYRNILTGDYDKEHIEIHGLPKRPPKTTKISLEAEFYSAEKGAVVIRDEGFGTMFPTTNKIYRKEFDLKWEK